MEEENVPNWLSAIVAKNRGEYEQFMQKVEEKHREFMQWMQASHEEFIQKMMQQIAILDTKNSTSTGPPNIIEETDNSMQQDAEAKKDILIKEHCSTEMETPSYFQEEDGGENERAESGRGFCSCPLRTTSLFAPQTGSSSSTCSSASISFTPSISIGASSMSAINSTSALGTGTSTFGQKPLFGELKSSSLFPLNPFGNTFSGTGLTFVSQPFSAISTSTCGSTLTSTFCTTTPKFGAMNTNGIGSPSNPITFGGTSTLTFGSTTSPFISQISLSGKSLFRQKSLFRHRSQSPARGDSLEQLNQLLGQRFDAATPLAFGKSTSRQKSSFRRFGSPNPTQSSSYGSPLGANSTSALGFTSAPAFGSKTSSFSMMNVTTFDAPSISGFKPSSLHSSEFSFNKCASCHRNTSCQTEPAFTFGAAIQPASSVTSIPAFGSTSIPEPGTMNTSFGATSTSSMCSFKFHSSPDFHVSATAVGATPATIFASSPSTSTCQTESIQPFLTSIQPASISAFCSTSIPAFGTITPFDATTAPAFGTHIFSTSEASSMRSFGFCSTPAFSLSATSVGQTSAAKFASSPRSTSYQTESGCRTQPIAAAIQPFKAVGSVSIPTFTFGTTNLPTVCSTSTSISEASSLPSFGFCSTPAFDLSATAFGATAPTFRFNASKHGSQGSTSGTQSTTSTFITEAFGRISSGNLRGSGLTSYKATDEADNWKTPGKFISISAMPEFGDQSHEELRFADYQLGNKGSKEIIKFSGLTIGK
ncbi:hypothetical protein SUGI_0364580 [Cryptomeria japonica]|uniref:nuclear pore complex protein NUP98A n=1 Tax=Cryptomeria japonica TaxID=3369 RepID=UPI002408BC93|nr:nuclear pore complex protein NUP98A [Cryptomeria japonica]GLJ20091.1 hypothetical protein SUGI_0364580 [Cryptomeria japonica]